MNNAIVRMYQEKNNGADPSGIVMPVYVRLRAHIANSDKGWCNSNVITLPKVVVSYVATMPKTVYIAGSSIRNGSEAKPLAAVYGFEGPVLRHGLSCCRLNIHVGRHRHTGQGLCTDQLV